MSPTYLSLVEKGKVEHPPTAERVPEDGGVARREPRPWIAMAGPVPDDPTEIIQSEPEAMPEVLRTAKGMNADELRKLTRRLVRKRDEGETG